MNYIQQCGWTLRQNVEWKKGNEQLSFDAEDPLPNGCNLPCLSHFFISCILVLKQRNTKFVTSTSHTLWHSPFLFIKSILRYNSYTIEFTHLKYTVQWLLVYSQSCTTINHIGFRIFSSHHRKKPIAISSHTLFPSTPPTSPPALGNHKFTFCLSRFFYSGQFI